MRKLSIIIPSHNDASYLRNLFLSISDLIVLPANQFEVIVVNNGSTDCSSELINSFEFREVYVDHKVTPSVARNLGVSVSTGDLLVFLDSDVVITDSWSKRISELAYNSKDENIFTGDYYHISKNPSWIEDVWFSGIYGKDHKYICGGNIIVSRTIFDLVDGFDEKLETGEDVDFSNRCSEIGKFPDFDERLYVYHEGYPKNILSFIKREIWHGKSDYSSIESFMSSKVALLAMFFFLMNILMLFFFITGNGTYFFTSVLLIFGCCICVIVKNNTFNSLKNIPFAVFVSYSYLLGRALSFFKR